MMLAKSLLLTSILAAVASAHVAAWTKGMYCLGGNDTTKDDPNTNLAVNPLWMLPKEQWWFQHDRGCDLAPPKSGDVLHLPANGNFTVELAHNRGQTTLSNPNGGGVSDWPDGLQHPDNWVPEAGQECLSDGAMHTKGLSTAAGTAFAISYQSELSQVTMENLVVFSTLSQQVPLRS